MSDTRLYLVQHNVASSNERLIRAKSKGQAQRFAARTCLVVMTPDQEDLLALGKNNTPIEDATQEQSDE